MLNMKWHIGDVLKMKKNQIKCVACGKCCKKHWLVKMTNDREKGMFKNLIYGEYIWTDNCVYQGLNGKCKIHDERQPYKCKEYFCEGREI